MVFFQKAIFIRFLNLFCVLYVYVEFGGVKLKFRVRSLHPPFGPGAQLVRLGGTCSFPIGSSQWTVYIPKQWPVWVMLGMGVVSL